MGDKRRLRSSSGDVDDDLQVIRRKPPKKPRKENRKPKKDALEVQTLRT